MRTKKAGDLFHGAEGYNCSQAVLKAFADVHDIDETVVKEHKAFGGGRAADGLCGALYSVKTLLGEGAEFEALADQFCEIAGSTRCREIRKINRLSCKKCVETAATLLQNHSRD